MEPAGLPIIAGNTFTKGGQSWDFAQDGVLSVSGHDCHCEVRFNLETYRGSHYLFDLCEQWELNLTCKSCQSSIWRGCNEVFVEWIPFYPCTELVGQITGKNDLIRASFLPIEILCSVLKLQKIEAAILLQDLSVADCEHSSDAIVKFTASFEVAPYRRKERAKRELDLESTVLPGKGKETISCTFP